MTDPLAWLPHAFMVAYIVQGALLFFGVVWHGRPSFINWIVGLVWLTCVFAMIPTVVAWIMGSVAWTAAVGIERDLSANYTMPTGFIAALLLFCGGFLYREVTWDVLVLFGRYVQPLIGYACRRAFEWLVALWREQRALP